MVVDIVRVENGFVKYRDTFPGGPTAYFADVTQPLFVAKNFILVFQTLVSDGVLVSSILLLPDLSPLGSQIRILLTKDLSLLRRLAIYLDSSPTEFALVLQRRLGHKAVCSNITSK